MKKLLKAVNGRYIVAVGEGAGKRHEVIDVPGLEVFEENGHIVLKTADLPTKITHPEHAEILLPENDEMTIYIQEEYNDVGEYRKVRD
jgi:hypothetical protein